MKRVLLVLPLLLAGCSSPSETPPDDAPVAPLAAVAPSTLALTPTATAVATLAPVVTPAAQAEVAAPTPFSVPDFNATAGVELWSWRMVSKIKGSSSPQELRAIGNHLLSESFSVQSGATPNSRGETYRNVSDTYMALSSYARERADFLEGSVQADVWPQMESGHQQMVSAKARLSDAYLRGQGAQK